ncbi:MAG: hypothetical protein AAF288_03895 [Planctomycetota bacterium]
MKTIGVSLLLVLAVNVLGAAAFVGWLGATDRLSETRLQRAVSVFEPTLAEEQAEQASADQLAAEAEAHAAQVSRMASIDRGLVTLAQRFDAERLTDDTARALLERTQREVAAIRQRLDTDRALLEDARKRLDEREAAFEQRVAMQADALSDEDFKRAVKTLSALPPDQAAGAVRAMIAGGNRDQAVAYLAAMTVGQSANVLREFAGPGDPALVAGLLESIRLRSEQLDAQQASADTPAGATG